LKDEDNKPYFVFNNYKTAGRYGEQIQEIPETLYNILEKWKTINPADHLLMNISNTKCITVTQVGEILNDFFEKKVSVSMLRHIWLSFEYKDMPKISELQENAVKMGHDIRTALEYVKRD
jgi:hypothetical protein